jgi:small subunit ribosomal protein S9
MSEYIEAVGRRKSATARVRLYEGEGEIIVNSMPMNGYFTRALDRMVIHQPLALTGTESSFNISIKVHGGGEGGQAHAVRHGLSRALVASNPGLRPTLKAAGFLTRDARVKERMKPGLKRARKAPQYTKR